MTWDEFCRQVRALAYQATQRGLVRPDGSPRANARGRAGRPRKGTILHLYLQRKDTTWMLRVPKKWHASDAIDALREHGMLHDWAKLVALYPGW